MKFRAFGTMKEVRRIVSDQGITELLPDSMMRSAAAVKKTCVMGQESHRRSLSWSLRTDEKWPFEQFRKALEDFSTDGLKAEARWQMLNASLNGIKRVIRQPGVSS